ncbi:uncharacterized protein F5891DRAFT_1160341 [Suillus fuscotomentosus]|uniref:RING-CH-type domain-containing protein n=1 Tax=Suillus fuscotomentosus TaxID=1912939 RepID=A0AAD4EL98_9AGAM|nr:uncharacterized protein F5891DRAFT_1164782 [Suillus fuscotomentosus]XP_041233741.1 uncharacterized protein F5891DRAFT_1160341 [Suillus fuscotomentosus]KAG1899305.1 hypothetical protein F5891DRAFT_1164782 [Suillus fuscotomentosus]KAG1908166.1 hypothetical protein F5891DRAFT_1160341 [Suillus fuscotomentosus]
MIMANMADAQNKPAPEQEKQCRICFDGEDDSLGRLIRPCLCKGSISYVHISCLKKWRNSSFSNNSFYRCPQCHYRYHFARTKAIGLATNPVVVGMISSFLFTLLVMCSSYVTTYFMSSFDDYSSYGSSYYFFISPIDVGHDLIRAALRILRDQDAFPLEDDAPRLTRTNPAPFPSSPSFLKRFVRRFVIGLPMIGAGSIVHMLLSLPLLGPVHWIARFRGNRSRRGNSTDIAAMIILGLLVIGIARALYEAYKLTRKISERLLLFAEDVILEVN